METTIPQGAPSRPSLFKAPHLDHHSSRCPTYKIISQSAPSRLTFLKTIIPQGAPSRSPFLKAPNLDHHSSGAPSRPPFLKVPHLDHHFSGPSRLTFLKVPHLDYHSSRKSFLKAPHLETNIPQGAPSRLLSFLKGAPSRPTHSSRRPHLGPPTFLKAPYHLDHHSSRRPIKTIPQAAPHLDLSLLKGPDLDYHSSKRLTDS
ncbi:hypothetical protein RRG08_003815 [Elysia crispata]|uniref:Uncharacterized protein n=1 Tax=Elysia crispata TaxID=231223 RepID=A0AAE1ED18_9GAST|nr:hypothetical protein RRG08_003815 [Elysia crispata]